MTDTSPADNDRAQSLLDKVRAFSEGLEPDERELFAVLIGPGVEALANDDEVSGFAQQARWEPGSLRSQLAGAVSNAEWRLVERR